jgi:hypothetical protein
MLLSIGSGAVLEAIFLGMKARSIPLPVSDQEFRLRYGEYLKAMQPECFWLRQGDEPLLVRSYDEATRRKLIDIFQEDTSRLDDRGQADVMRGGGAIPSRHADVVESAIQHMARVAPEHHQFLTSCIERIFIEPSEVASGGSTSSAVGVIWANPHPAFTTMDTVEFLVHELTHNLLFLDEWVHPHYDYEAILDERTWCPSAILKRPRPLDKVIHSVVVAAEIVLLREQRIGEPTAPHAHPPSDSIVRAIHSSIRSIRQLRGSRERLFPRVWEILEQIEASLAAREDLRHRDHALVS